MSRIKNSIIALLSIAMLLAFGSVNALGAETGTGVSPSSVLDVTVPTQIAITTDAEGNTHVPDNLEIKNNSAYYYVCLDKAIVSPATGWHFDASGNDVANYGPGTKGFSLSLFGQKAVYDNAKALYAFDLTSVEKVSTRNSTSIPCDAYVPAQMTTQNAEAIADVTLVVHAEEAPLPMLAAQETWYKGTISKADLTKISFVSEYAPTGDEDEVWDASAAQDNSVLAYRRGTEVTLVSKMLDIKEIYANPDSSRLFSAPNSRSIYASFSDSNLIEIEGCNLLNTSKVTNLKSAFKQCKKITTVNLATWDTSNVTSLAGTFYQCSGLTSLEPIAAWDTSNVTSLASTFYQCSGLTSLEPIAAWDTSNVTSLASTFYQCSGLTTIDLSGWNTSKVTSLTGTFFGCSGLTSLEPIAGWDTSNVTSLWNTFYQCSGLTSLEPIAAWDTSNVTSLWNTFYQCSGLTTIDLSG